MFDDLTDRILVNQKQVQHDTVPRIPIVSV